MTNTKITANKANFFYKSHKKLRNVGPYCSISIHLIDQQTTLQSYSFVSPVKYISIHQYMTLPNKGVLAIPQ